MNEIHGVGASKMKSTVKSPRSPISSNSRMKSTTIRSPRSPISPTTSLKSGNGGISGNRSESTSIKFEKPPKIARSSSSSSNKSSKNFSRFPSESKELIKKQNNVSDNELDYSADLGPFLLNQARNLISDNPRRALQLALRASKSLEKNCNAESSLDLVMCLHVIALILCKLERYDEAIPVLERAIGIPTIEAGEDHSLAKFSGYMQLGDTYAMLGQLANAIQCYTSGLEVQIQALGENDSRVGDTYRFLAEAHMQALQFDEAEILCQKALEVHREQGEAADRRLLGLICDMKGNYEQALEHLIFANCQEPQVGSVDCSIGDTYLSLARYDEAIFAYQKALTIFMSTKGENHPNVASVIVRLANLYSKIGKFKEAKSYCESALRIYENPQHGTPFEEVAVGFTEVSAIYESIGESGQTIKFLRKAIDIYNNARGHQSTIAGIEAQLGVMYYVTGNYDESYDALKGAIEKLRACGEKKPAFFGIVLNQMGLACLHKDAVSEAAELFEEARRVLERECGPYHLDTLGVCSNLAGAYDAMGRLDKAIEILDHVVRARDERLGTAGPDVDDERSRLYVLMKEAGRGIQHRKTRSLEELLDSELWTVKSAQDMMFL